MGVAALLVRDGFRRSLGALVAVAFVITMGLGAGLASFEVAERTQRAYPDYLRRAEVGELVVNPGLVTDRTESFLRSVPGVIDLASDSLLTAEPTDGAPQPSPDFNDDFLQVRMSEDGRYVDQDRPIVHAGRMVRSGKEAFLSVEAAAALNLDVGDVVPLQFYTSDLPAVGFGIEPIGVSEARVVGIGVFADEALPDELIPRYRVLVTPEVASQFSCTPTHPDPDDSRSLEELAPALFPRDCTVSYRYYSLHVEGGDAGAAAVAAALREKLTAENERLPASLREIDAGYSVFPQFRADDEDRVEESLAPAVTALRVFGATTALATVVVALLLAVRAVRRRAVSVAVWRGLGLTRRQRALGLALPVSVAVAAGIVGSLAVAWLVSNAGPIASARAIVPDDDRALSSAVVIPIAGAAFVLVVGVVIVTALAARVTAIAAGRGSRTRWAPGANGPPALSLGLRAAMRGTGARAVLASAATAVLAVAATLTFSADVLELVNTPERYGWGYDAALLVSFGYGPTNLEAVATTLDRDEVETWEVAALTGAELAVNGISVPFVAGRRGHQDLIAGTVISGALPHAEDEIALGALTADELDVDVGDEVDVTTRFGGHAARVSGIAVLPSVGPLNSDRSSLGTGVLVSTSLFETLLADAPELTGMSAPELADNLAAFVIIDLADGVDATAFLEDIHDESVPWDGFGVAPLAFGTPVRPAVIVDVAGMRRIPMMLAGVFALAMTVGVVAGIAGGTRARRRELSIVRALGATPGQLRASVRWHALAVVATGLVVGLPVGAAVGAIAFRAFALDIGAAPATSTPIGLLLAIVVAVFAIGLAAAALPARGAANARIAPNELR